MSHEIEFSTDTYEAAFATRGKPAWHSLGTVFDREVTTKEMLELAHLNDWDVRLEPVLVEGVHESRFAVEQFATTRRNPFDGARDVLGFVGGRYKVSQNEEVLGFGDSLFDGVSEDYGIRWETAGSLNGGRRIFASLSIDNAIVIDPNGANDRIETYVVFASSHDGSTPLTAMNTPVRPVCSNTLNAAFQSATQTFKVRHTSTLQGKVAAARETLQISEQYFAQFNTFANDLFQMEMSMSDFTKVATTLYPKPDGESKAAATRWTNKIDLLQDLFLGRPQDGPQTNVNITGTAWGGLNALTEAIDWYRKPRKGSAESVLAAASGFDQVVNAEKNKIFKTFAAMV